MKIAESPGGEALMLLRKWRSFAFPEGEDAVKGVRAFRSTQKGEICSAPGARWIPFTAEETFETTRSGFIWEARLRAGKLVPMLVTDAYEQGHGRLVVKIAGALPVVNARGPEFDRGELQRCLAGIMGYPAALLARPDLEWTAVAASTLRVRDTGDSTGATVDIDLDEAGRPLGCRAERPRAVGKETVLTPWTATSAETRIIEGMRTPTHLEAAWVLPDGVFTYFRVEVTSLVAQR